MIPVCRSELILGGQKSGKSRRAESLAVKWLSGAERNQAIMIATGQAWDDEMTQRIARHQQDRAIRVPGMRTIEEPLNLAQALKQHDSPDTLLVVDCLTMWLTNRLMPVSGSGDTPQQWQAALHELQTTLQGLRGSVVMVGNEIGLGVIPMGQGVRHFVDALGVLNQALAQQCQRVTLMVAGLPLVLKEPA